MEYVGVILLVIAWLLNVRTSMRFQRLNREFGSPDGAITFGLSGYPWRLFRSGAFGLERESDRKRLIKEFWATNSLALVAALLFLFGQ